MKTLFSDDITPSSSWSSEEKHWAYNALDCCVTHEVFGQIESQLDATTRATYEFAKALQGPVLEMKLRGILIDQQRRAEVLHDFEEKLNVLSYNLSSLVCDGIGYKERPPESGKLKPHHFNWRSPVQIKELFYGVMRIPERTKKGKVSVDRDILEKLADYFYAEPVVQHLLALRDLGKKIGVLRTGIDDDGRLRTSFNIAGTDTGRFSSNVSDFGTGTNLQNIEDSLRSILVADPNYKFAYIDLEQAESRAVGAICWNLFQRGAYLDACESGDLHTTVTRLARKGLAWTGDPRLDREIAEGVGYRHLSLRDLSKKLGHGSNYFGQPPTMARHSRLPVQVVKEFQGDYFAAFPEIPMWHEWVRRTLQEHGCITSLSGRRRWFFGRRNEDTTLRAAIAYDPQGSVGDILNRGMLQVWNLHCCHLLLQVHDAILIQYPAHLESSILPRVTSALTLTLPLLHSRTLTIPCDVAVGWNFGKWDEDKNPDGLKKYKGTDTRRRQRQPETSRLAGILGGLDLRHGLTSATS